MFSLFLVLVQYLQAVLGYTALAAAAALLPMAAMMLPLSTVAPSIAERVGLRRTLVIGTLTMAVGLVTLAFMAVTDGGFARVLPAPRNLCAGLGVTRTEGRRVGKECVRA